MKQIPDEIKAGMELLDREMPGWREKINPNLLNLGHCKQCILGQLFRRFDIGVDLLGVRPELYGFEVYPILGSGIDEKYKQLTAAWRAALSEPSSPIAAE